MEKDYEVFKQEIQDNVIKMGKICFYTKESDFVVSFSKYKWNNKKVQTFLKKYKENKEKDFEKLISIDQDIYLWNYTNKKHRIDLILQKKGV